MTRNIAFLFFLMLLLTLSCGEPYRVFYSYDKKIESALAGYVPSYPDIRFAVFSDPHFYDIDLGIEGSAFQKYLDQDRKLLREGQEIASEAIDEIISIKPELVIVSGDLTKDGEKSSHKRFKALIERVTKSGISVFVIPGNHDINNPDAMRFAGDSVSPVDTISDTDFASIYADFGYSSAVSRDPASLSYTVDLKPGLLLLALDACLYRDNVAGKHPVTNGRFSTQTVSWIESSLYEAVKNKKAVIAVMHHGLIEHYKGQEQFYGDYIVDSSESIARLLAAYGVRVIFTGHYHAQDITLKSVRAGNNPSFILDVETGSLLTYPCPFRIVTISDNLLDIESSFISKTASHSQGDFSEYAREYTWSGIKLIAKTTLKKYGLAETEADGFGEQVADAFIAHYHGDEKQVKKDVVDYSKLGIWGRIVVLTRSGLITGLWNDLLPSDNSLQVDLATGTLAQSK